MCASSGAEPGSWNQKVKGVPLVPEYKDLGVFFLLLLFLIIFYFFLFLFCIGG